MTLKDLLFVVFGVFVSLCLITQGYINEDLMYRNVALRGELYSLTLVNIEKHNRLAKAFRKNLDATSELEYIAVAGLLKSDINNQALKDLTEAFIYLIEGLTPDDSSGN